MTPAIVLRKFKTAVTNPVAAVRVLGHYVAQWQGRRGLIQLGLAEEVAKVEAKCKAINALPPNYTELLNLYKDVRKRRPAVIFEFGSGLSTHFIGAALRDNAAEGGAKGKLFSLETEQEWLNFTVQWLNENIRPYVELVHAPASIEEMHGKKVFCHSNIPSLTPDMVYLDGPKLTPEVRSAADLLKIELKLKAGFWLVIDGRRDNAAFLEEHFQRKYSHTVRTGLLGGAYMQRCYELLGENG